jgi:hypothetical protein
VGVIAVDEAGGVRHVVDGRRVVSGFDVSGGAIAFTASAVSDPGGLFVDDVRMDPPIEGLGLVEADHFRVESGGLRSTCG